MNETIAYIVLLICALSFGMGVGVSLLITEPSNKKEIKKLKERADAYQRLAQALLDERNKKEKKEDHND